jgi:hypothetical protein
MFFTSPENTRWNTERQAVELDVEIGEYRGVFQQRGNALEPVRVGSTLPRTAPG